MAYTYAAVPNLIRQELYDAELTKALDNWLIGRPLFDDKTGIFGDGDTLNVTDTGYRDTEDYTDNSQITFDATTTNRRTLSIDQYKSDAFFVTDQMKDDSHQAEAFFAENVAKSALAMETSMEADLLTLGDTGQTSGNANTINGQPHRFKASGTGGVLTVDDIARLKLGFDAAYVPVENRILLITPETEYELNKLIGFTEVTNGSQFNWDVQGLVQTGFGEKLNVVRNIMGFNIVISHNLPTITTETLAEGDGTGSGPVSGVGCIALSAASSASMPFMGAIRRAPSSEMFRNTNFKRDEWSATCRYGFAVKRPESFSTIVVPA